MVYLGMDLLSLCNGERIMYVALFSSHHFTLIYLTLYFCIAD